MRKKLFLIPVLCLMVCTCLCIGGCGTDDVEPEEAEFDLDEIVSGIEVPDGFVPEIGIVLGSGLAGLSDEVEVVSRISYNDIDGFPHSTVEGHKGEYIFGYLEGVPVILMNGRVHYYEGYTMEEVVTPDRIMAKLGAGIVIQTHASGSLVKDLSPGTLVCDEDQISSFVPSPLIGQNDEELGERFVAMDDAYDPDLRKILHKAAKKENIDLKDGVFLQVTGPAFETEAESKMYASLGADTVGMSTACETIALRHMGVRVLSISCITNYCPNCTEGGTSHEEVKEAAHKAGADMVRLVKRTVKMIGR